MLTLDPLGCPEYSLQMSGEASMPDHHPHWCDICNSNEWPNQRRKEEERNGRTKRKKIISIDFIWRLEYFYDTFEIKRKSDFECLVLQISLSFLSLLVTSDSRQYWNTLLLIHWHRKSSSSTSSPVLLLLFHSLHLNQCARLRSLPFSHPLSLTSLKFV